METEDQTSLSGACTDGDLECVLMLCKLNAGAEHIAFNSRTSIVGGAYEVSVQLEALTALRDRGAVFFHARSIRDNLLFTAVRKGSSYEPIVRFLCANSVGLAGDAQVVCLFEAVGKGLLSLLCIMLDTGFPIDASLKDTNTTLLMVAAADGHAAIVRELCKRGASVNACDAKGGTALHFATSHSRIAAVLALGEAGCDMHLVDAEGRKASDVVGTRQYQA
jgi:ankyrin repeat protein